MQEGMRNLRKRGGEKRKTRKGEREGHFSDSSANFTLDCAVSCILYPLSIIM